MNRSIAATTGGAAIGLFVGRLVGEPPNSVHPVARSGQAMVSLENRTYADSRAAGIGYTAVGVLAASLVGVAVGRAIMVRSRFVSTIIVNSLMIARRCSVFVVAR